MKDFEYILFLDFDGVLTSDDFDATYQRKAYIADEGSLDPKCVANLQKVLDLIPKLAIVVSSTWKQHHNLVKIKEVLKDKGLKNPERVIDVTPYFPNDLRSVEIKTWLNSHPGIKGFVIIDDEPAGVAALSTHLVMTDKHTGMKIQDVQEIIMKIYQN